MFDRKKYMKDYHRKQYLSNKETITAKNKQYALEHKDEIDQYKLKWYCDNKSRILDTRKKKYSEKSVSEKRAKNLKANYNISLEEYESILVAQDYKCKCCGIDSKYLKKHLSVDHDHKTGKVRGLLCSNCNLILGLVHDNPEILVTLASYLIDNNKFREDNK